MMKRLQNCVFLLISIACLSARADLENFVVEKRVVNYQTSSSTLNAPTNGAFLDYYFEIDGAPTLESASFSANFSNAPFQFQDDLVWRGFVAFATQAELNTAYNNAYFYAFTTKLEGEFAKTSQTDFISTAAFPIAQPQLTNFPSLSSVNPSVSFNIQLAQSAFGSAGSGFSNYIQLMLIEPVDSTTRYSNTYPGTSIFLNVPANSTESSHDYLARIQFISPAKETTPSGVSPYSIYTQFSNETWFRLSTIGIRQSLSPTLARYVHWTQTSASAITANSEKDYLLGYVDQPIAANLSAVTLTQLDVRRSYFFDTPTDPGTHDFELKLTGEDFNNFISGVISLGWRYTSGNTQLEIDNWDCAISSTPPMILNWEACQSITAGTDFSLIIEQPSDLPDDITATLIIRDSEDEIIAALENEITAENEQYAFVIPAETLAAMTTYNADLTLQGDASTQGAIDARNAHNIQFQMTATDGNWPGVASAGIYRGVYFDNGGATSPTNNASMRFIIQQDPTDGVDDAKVNRPIETRLFLLDQNSRDPNTWQNVLLDDETAIANAYPDGGYWFQTWKESILYTRALSYSTPTESAPSITVDTSALTAGPDPSLPIPISWTGFDASAEGMRVEAYIATPTSLSIPLTNIAADGLSGEIPIGALDPETTYSIHLFFQRDVTTDSASYENTTLIAGDEFFTVVDCTTSAETYQNWLAGYLSPTQLSDPTFAASTANPDGDALTNLQEFALNGNPLQPTPPPVLEDGGANYLLTFQYRSDSALLSYAAEYSTTLQPPFDAYTGTPIVTPGNPYDSIILPFAKLDKLFVRLIIRYGEAGD